MAQPVRMQKIARLLQKALGEIFVQETSRLLGNRIVTVTEVCISPDLGLAKVYLSFILNKEGEDMLAKVAQHKGVVRKLLGERIGNKLRKVPELRFYTDDSVTHAAKMHKLLDGLDTSEDAILMQHEELIG
jgi:ribosome-binding factor A